MPAIARLGYLGFEASDLAAWERVRVQEGDVEGQAGRQLRADPVREHVAPRIGEAAAAVGRPSPRILAGVPVCVTDAPDRARAFAAEQLKLYGQLPAYRAMLEREGVQGPEALLVTGPEDVVREQLAAFEEAGATDLRVGALCRTPEEGERTRALLRALCQEEGIRLRARLERA